MEAILATDNFTDADKNILIRLAFHLNMKTGRCDPSVARLAAGANKSKRAVQKTLRNAEMAGWIARVVGGGRGKTNSHRLLLPHSGAAANAETVNCGAPFSEAETANACPPFSDPETVNVRAHKGARDGQKPCTAVHPNIENNEKNNALAGELATAPLSGALARLPYCQDKASSKQGNNHAVRARDRNRGTHENEIARRLDPLNPLRGWDMLMAMSDRDVDRLFELQRDDKLTDSEIVQLRLRYGRLSISPLIEAVMARSPNSADPPPYPEGNKTGFLCRPDETTVSANPKKGAPNGKASYHHQTASQQSEAAFNTRNSNRRTRRRCAGGRAFH
jgi:hypothetical protein